MKKCLVGLSALLAMGVAFASGDNFLAKPASYAAAGTVIGIDAGWGWSNAYANSLDFSDGSPDVFKNRNDYYGMFDGGVYVGYNFHPTTNWLMGVELGYKFVGYSSTTLKIPGDDETFSKDLSTYQNIVDLLFTAHYYVYKGWNMFAKAGVAGTFQTDPLVTDVTVLASNSDDTVTNFRLLPEYTLGMGYTWNQKVDLHLSYNHIGNAVLVDDDLFMTTNSIMLGLSYTFPSGM